MSLVDAWILFDQWVSFDRWFCLIVGFCAFDGSRPRAFRCGTSAQAWLCDCSACPACLPSFRPRACSTRSILVSSCQPPFLAAERCALRPLLFEQRFCQTRHRPPRLSCASSMNGNMELTRGSKNGRSALTQSHQRRYTLKPNPTFPGAHSFAPAKSRENYLWGYFRKTIVSRKVVA
jgi:hypothetical protein